MRVPVLLFCSICVRLAEVVTHSGNQEGDRMTPFVHMYWNASMMSLEFQRAFWSECSEMFKQPEPAETNPKKHNHLKLVVNND